jgi:Ca-activated chloride channel family protein
MTRHAAALVLLSSIALAAAQDHAPPAITIDAPEPGAYVSGPFAMRASAPVDADVISMSFFVDGRLACVVARAPWECTWDAGATIVEHLVRVVATTRGGGRLVASVRTRGTRYAETVDVDAVQVTVTVTDADGNFVSGLPETAFHVSEDGVPQTLSAFLSEEIPLEIVVALDVSQSMTPAIPVLKASARSFLSALRPTDQVTLIAFNDNIFTLARRSTDPAARMRAVDRLAPWGGTALYDVVLTGLAVVGRQPGRRALVVFSDGEDQSSVATLQQVHDRLERSDAVVYTIGLGRGAREDALRRILERLAGTSGGRAFMTERAERLERAFSQILEELGHQYLVAYSPSNTRRDGTWRRIDVTVDGGHTVRARQGYRAADGRKR